MSNIFTYENNNKTILKNFWPLEVIPGWTVTSRSQKAPPPPPDWQIFSKKKPCSQEN
jgi:hypothetical protein